MIKVCYESRYIQFHLNVYACKLHTYKEKYVGENKNVNSHGYFWVVESWVILFSSFMLCIFQLSYNELVTSTIKKINKNKFFFSSKRFKKSFYIFKKHLCDQLASYGEQGFSNFNVHRNKLGILVKCTKKGLASLWSFFPTTNKLLKWCRNLLVFAVMAATVTFPSKCNMYQTSSY